MTTVEKIAGEKIFSPSPKNFYMGLKYTIHADCTNFFLDKNIAILELEMTFQNPKVE